MYAIEYESRSTINGKPLGRVFALDVNDISPGCWSYVHDPHEATLFSSEKAARAAVSRYWHDIRIVEV